jgi:hypothetical protein
MAKSSRASSGSGRKATGKASTDARPRRGSTAKKPAAKTKAPAKRGKSVETRAKQTVPKGPRLTAFERVMQASFIGIRRAQGATWTAVARDVGLSARRCQELHKQLLASQDQAHTLKRDPTELIEWVLTEFESDLAAYTLAAMSADTDSARVGALNGRGKALERILALLQQTNRLPRNLGTITHIHDLKLFTRQVNVLLVGIERGEFTREDFAAFFEQRVGIELPTVTEKHLDEVRTALEAVRPAA